MSAWTIMRAASSLGDGFTAAEYLATMGGPGGGLIVYGYPIGELEPELDCDMIPDAISAECEECVYAVELVTDNEYKVEVC